MGSTLQEHCIKSSVELIDPRYVDGADGMNMLARSERR